MLAGAYPAGGVSWRDAGCRRRPRRAHPGHRRNPRPRPGGHRPRRRPRRALLRARRPGVGPTGHAGHAVRDRLDHQVVHRRLPDAPRRERRARPGGGGALAAAAVPGARRHRPPASDPHRRAADGPGRGPVDADVGAPPGADDGGAARAVLVLEPRLPGARHAARAADGRAVPGDLPARDLRAARDGVVRAGHPQRDAAAAGGRPLSGRRRAAVASRRPAGACHVAGVRGCRRQRLLHARRPGGLRADAARRRRRRARASRVTG